MSSDATISILTDDEEDSSESEIYSRPEPETESRSEQRPMIGRRDRSRDDPCSDDRVDASDSLLGTKNGLCNGKGLRGVDVSEDGFLAMETGSEGCLGTSLSPATMLVLCLLVVAFPVHFPSVLLPDVACTDVALPLTVCLAIVGAIVASMTSQLAFKMAAFNFRSLLLAGCVGVMVFAFVRCIPAVPGALLGCASFVAGFLLTEARVAASSWYCRPAPPPLPSLLNDRGPQPRRYGDDATTYLACGLLTLACCAVAPFISASLNLAFLATYYPSPAYTDVSATSSVTSSVTSFPLSNATLSVDELSSWWNITSESHQTSSMASAISTSSPESTTGSYTTRLVALSVSYVVCSLGALIVVLYTFDDDDRYRKDTFSWRVSGVGRLVLGPLRAFKRQDVLLLLPLALFVGAQQMFAYFAYIQVS